VVGDLLLDREVLGAVDRMCPEAPVPVLDEVEILDRPGGAGLAALFVGSAAGNRPAGRVAASAGPATPASAAGPAMPASAAGPAVPAFELSTTSLPAAGMPGAPRSGHSRTGRGRVSGDRGYPVQDHPRPGRSPREVVLVAAVSADNGGDRVRELLARAGVRLIDVPLLGPTPEKIRLRAGDRMLLRLDRGNGPSRLGAASAEAVDVIHAAAALLVSDYGHGVTGHPRLRAAVAERAPCVPVVWDPHPRGGHPVAATRLVTPNRSEAGGFVASKLGAAHGVQWPLTGQPQPAPGNGNDAGAGAGAGNACHDPVTVHLAQAAGMAVRLRRYWAAGAVAVTLAEQGAVLSDGVHPPLLVPAPFNAYGDTCGAGDRFAGAAIASLSEGSSVLDAVTAGVTAATAYVAAGGAVALCPELHERADLGSLPIPRPQRSA
jgi:bifunctional ADP-heptose synthase (sugar kinase/adenylyltransferase)